MKNTTDDIEFVTEPRKALGKHRLSIRIIGGAVALFGIFSFFAIPGYGWAMITSLFIIFTGVFLVLLRKKGVPMLGVIVFMSLVVFMAQIRAGSFPIIPEAVLVGGFVYIFMHKELLD